MIVRHVATKVREWAEEWNDRNNHPFPESLQGMCVICAAKLLHELHKAKVDATGYLNSSHGFVIVDDHIVDVTASQFGFPDVFIEHHALHRDSIYWKIESAVKIEQAWQFREIQLKEGWIPKELVPKNLQHAFCIN